MKEETRCRQYMELSFVLGAMIILYALYHRQANTYHRFCNSSRGATAVTRNMTMGPP